LDVDHDATDDEIRHAYKQMALRYHPDRNTDQAAANTEMVLLDFFGQKITIF
jgi:DnaJ-class molecular chaperone